MLSNQLTEGHFSNSCNAEFQRALPRHEYWGEQLRQLVARGATAAEAAHEMAISTGSAIARASKLGLKLIRKIGAKHNRPELAEKIIDLRLDDPEISILEIARRCELTYDVAMRYCAELGIGACPRYAWRYNRGVSGWWGWGAPGHIMQKRPDIAAKIQEMCRNNPTCSRGDIARACSSPQRL